MQGILDEMRKACDERSLKALEICAKILPHLDANISNAALERNSRHPFLACLYHAVMTGADLEQLKNWAGLIRQEISARQWPATGLICFQSPLISEFYETRGISLTPSRVNEDQCNQEFSRYDRMIEDLGLDGFKKLIDPISSYTIVDLNGFASPKLYSGSRSSCFRSAHGAAIGSLEEYIEILSHEASHISIFNLETKMGALVLGDYSKAHYYSPWRRDPRPVYGLFHGAMVFSIAARFLSKLESQRAQMRVSKLCVELEEAFRQLRNHAQLSDQGSDMLKMAVDDISAIKFQLPPSFLMLEQEVSRERKAIFLKKHGSGTVHVS
jgi:hypothetical protein